MESFPGVVEHTNADLLEDVPLIFVFCARDGLAVAILQRIETIVTPEREIEGELLLLLRVHEVGDHRLRVRHINAAYVLAIDLRQERSDSNAYLNATHILNLNKCNWYIKSS